MNTEQERKDFESWARGHLGMPDDVEFNWHAEWSMAAFEGYQAGRSYLESKDSRWMPIECDGKRDIPYPFDTLIDIQTDDGTIFYGVRRGDVCVFERPPVMKVIGFYDPTLSPYMAHWFGVVNRYRLHDKERK